MLPWMLASEVIRLAVHLQPVLDRSCQNLRQTCMMSLARLGVDQVSQHSTVRIGTQLELFLPVASCYHALPAQVSPMGLVLYIPIQNDLEQIPFDEFPDKLVLLCSGRQRDFST